MIDFCPCSRHFNQFKDPQNTKYLNDEDPATHKAQTKLQLKKMHVADGQNYESAYYAVINQCFISYACCWLCFFQVNNCLV